MLGSIFRKLRTIFRPRGTAARVVLDTSVLVAALFNPGPRACWIMACRALGMVRLPGHHAGIPADSPENPPIRHQAKTYWRNMTAILPSSGSKPSPHWNSPSPIHRIANSWPARSRRRRTICFRWMTIFFLSTIPKLSGSFGPRNSWIPRRMPLGEDECKPYSVYNNYRNGSPIALGLLTYQSIACITETR